MIELILLIITSTIGILWISYNFIIPIIDAFLFASGDTIFNTLCLGKSKIIKHPFKFIRFIIKNFINEFIDRSCAYSSLDSKRSTKWIWKPYFHYKRIK